MSSAMTIASSNDGHEAMNTRQATGLQLRQLINLLRRRWKLIIVAAGVAVGLAGSIGLVLPPRYTATAQVIVDPPRSSSGAGEPSAAVIPSAVGNAVFDATGVRLRSIPYSPAKVKAAMQAT